MLVCVLAIFETIFAGLILFTTGPPYAYMNWCFSYPSMICFLLVSASTVFLVVRLKANLSWRSRLPNQLICSSAKEIKASRSVILICWMFIISFIPNIFLVTAALVYPEFTLQGPYYKWLVHILAAFAMLFQMISSSVNVFVYYSMSTRFREVFIETFCRK
ncbi:chemosensory receptor A [Elysia marginata]|uniref:Chemosensory receptor A n=1 Tax=Elysia marginata TaxID=1093978 RepID=A0AAV4IBJ3_9GAST|nr:chemosensory receptor A [Elysia marginata]